MPLPAFRKKCSGLVQAVYQLSLLIPPCFHSSQSFIGLCRILSQHVLFKLRLVLHPTLWGHWILPANPWVLCLHVLLICHLLLLFGGHVLRLHTSATGHGGLGSWNLRVIDVFGRVDGRFGIDAILIARRRFGRIETCLEPTFLTGVKSRRGHH